MVKDTNSINGSTTDELMAEMSQYWDNLEGSNIYKLVDSFNQPMTGLSQTAQKIEDWRQIKEAEGTTLDLIGEDRKTYRPSDDDDVFRFLLYIQFLLSQAQGTIPSIVKITTTALQMKDGVEVFNTDMPHHIGIRIPMDHIKNQQMQKLVMNKLEDMIGLGYWLDMIVFKSVSPLSLYIGVGDQDTWQNTQETDMVWWTGWKSKTAGDLHIGIGTNANDSTIWSSDTVWWSGWKAQTTPASYICIAGRYVNSSVWSTELINS